MGSDKHTCRKEHARCRYDRYDRGWREHHRHFLTTPIQGDLCPTICRCQTKRRSQTRPMKLAHGEGTFRFVPAEMEFMRRWMSMHADSHITLGRFVLSLVCAIVQRVLRNEGSIPPMSFIKVGRSKDATLNTSGSAVQMTGVEPHNTTEDRHVHPYFLYSANGNYSDSAFVLQDTYVKICHNNFQSSR